MSVFKALGRPLPYKDVEVVNDSSGRPVLKVKGMEKGLRLSISLSRKDIRSRGNHCGDFRRFLPFPKGGQEGLVILVNAETMKRLDRKALREYGIKGIVLMEKRGPRG